MSRAITRHLLAASLTFILILQNSALVYAIPTPATDIIAAIPPNSGIKQVVDGLSPQDGPISAGIDLPFKGCSTFKHPASGAIDGVTDDASPFWMEKIKRQGKAPFNPDPDGYKVFRNVKVRTSFLTDFEG